MKAKVGYLSCALIIVCCVAYAKQEELLHFFKEKAWIGTLATHVDIDTQVITDPNPERDLTSVQDEDDEDEKEVRTEVFKDTTPEGQSNEPQSETPVARSRSVVDTHLKADEPTHPAIEHSDAQAKNGTVIHLSETPVLDVKSVVDTHSEDVEPVNPGIENFDAKAKSEAVVRLVEKGEKFLLNNDPVIAFQAFNGNKNFVVGELYLFAYDLQGICLSHGQDNSLIWKNQYDLKDTYGVEIVKGFIKEAMTPTNNGWVTYEWKGATKISYVKKVTKGDKAYVIGCGYYPHSKTDAVENLVKSAVALFNDVIKHGRPKDEALSTFSYPLGRFVLGDLYLYALSFEGVHVAHGEMPGLIGTNGLQYRTGGRFLNQEIIQKLKDKGSGGIWIEYESKNAIKKTYAERIVDGSGKEYFIACGFYPTADKEQVVNLVKRAYQYMKGNGKGRAARLFSDPQDNTFRYGDLYLVVYDMQGRCIADGRNTSFIGSEQLDIQDEDGQFYVREMLRTAKAGGGWVNYKIRNSFKSSYVEQVVLGVDSYVITCGLYPVSKYETMFLLAQSGADYLKANKQEKAYGAFVDEHSKFVRGDLFIFALDTNGVCFAYGPNRYDLIWKNLMNLKDDEGKQFVKALINHASKGAGTTYYKLNGVRHLTYAEPIEKDGKTIIIGSGYFL